MHNIGDPIRPYKMYRVNPNWMDHVPSEPPHYLGGENGPAQTIKTLVVNCNINNCFFEYRDPDGDAILRIHLHETPYDMRYGDNLPVVMYCLVHAEDTSREAMALSRNGGLGSRGRRHAVVGYYVAPNGNLYPPVFESEYLTKTEAVKLLLQKVRELKEYVEQ